MTEIFDLCLQEAEDLHQTLAKRFSVNKDVWTNFGEFYFEHGEAEKARKLMQRSFKSLPNNQRKSAQICRPG